MSATDETRERILTAALQLFLGDGYEQTTVAKIREASGVSNGALFHRFASKEAIAAALYLDAIESFQEGHWVLAATQPAGLRQAVLAIVGHQLAWIEQHPDQARFIYDRGQLDWSEAASESLRELNSKMLAAYKRWLAPMVASGELREQSSMLFISIVAGPSHYVAQQWLRGDRKRPLTDYADELAHAAWAGVATPEALTGASREQPRSAAARPVSARVHVELLDDAGRVVASHDGVSDLGG